MSIKIDAIKMVPGDFLVIEMGQFRGLFINFEESTGRCVLHHAHSDGEFYELTSRGIEKIPSDVALSKVKRS